LTSTNIRHGDHHWDIADPVPEPRFGDADWSRATVRHLLDDAATWTALARAAIRTGITPNGDTQTARMLAHHLDAPASQVAAALAPDERFPGATELRNEIATLLAPPHPALRPTSIKEHP
jgi:alpha-L-rhamnosidase